MIFHKQKISRSNERSQLNLSKLWAITLISQTWSSVHKPKVSGLKGRLCLHEKKDLLHCHHFILPSSRDFRNISAAIFQRCTLVWHIGERKIISLLRISGLGHWTDPSYGYSNEGKSPQVRKGPCGDKVINIILTWISLIWKNHSSGPACAILQLQMPTWSKHPSHECWSSGPWKKGFMKGQD